MHIEPPPNKPFANPKCRNVSYSAAASPSAISYPRLRVNPQAGRHPIRCCRWIPQRIFVLPSVMAITEFRKAVKVVSINRFVILARGIWNTVIFPWKSTSGAGTYMSKSYFYVHLRDTVQISYDCRYILYIFDIEWWKTRRD